jgi:predicted DNA-binding transcriptional regulator AlpA
MDDQLDVAIRQQRSVPQIGNDDDVVLPFLEWCALAGLSEPTARRMRARGDGPRCVHIGERALGVTLAEHRRWVKERME